MFDLEQRLDRLFEMVDGEQAQKCITRFCKVTFVIVVVVAMLNIDTLVTIYRGMPSP